MAHLALHLLLRCLLLHQSIVDLAARGADVDAADAAAIEAAITRNRATAQKRQKARYTWRLSLLLRS
jgi:hypothetical protein